MQFLFSVFLGGDRVSGQEIRDQNGESDVMAASALLNYWTYQLLPHNPLRTL